MASFPTRLLSTHMRGASGSAPQSPALVARIEEKKAELRSLKELRDLSAAVATQMEALEQKLSTLSDGTEAVAVVMGNWHNVLRAINMASGIFQQLVRRKLRNRQAMSRRKRRRQSRFRRHWCAYQQRTRLHSRLRRRRQQPKTRRLRAHDKDHGQGGEKINRPSPPPWICDMPTPSVTEYGPTDDDGTFIMNASLL